MEAQEEALNVERADPGEPSVYRVGGAGLRPLARLCLSSNRLRSLAVKAINLTYSGFWLGVLRPADQQGIDQAFYAGSTKYQTEAYNLKGLVSWEEDALRLHFGSCGSLFVMAAGGGREVVALAKRGLAVTGVECNSALVEFANGLLRREGVAAAVAQGRPNSADGLSGVFDGGIVGWGAYMHIRGRARRVAFLQALKGHLAPDGPLLLSFYTRQGTERSLLYVYRIAKVVAAIFRRPAPELGDAFPTLYFHMFTQEEIEAELREAGFDAVFYGSEDYGRAVGLARAQT